MTYILSVLSARFQLKNWSAPARLGSESSQLGLAWAGKFQLELISSTYLFVSRACLAVQGGSKLGIKNGWREFQGPKDIQMQFSQSTDLFFWKFDAFTNFVCQELKRCYTSYAFYASDHLCSMEGKNFHIFIFRLFPIISISQKIFSIFFLTLEKIGIDEKVICYHNISN